MSLRDEFDRPIEPGRWGAPGGGAGAHGPEQQIESVFNLVARRDRLDTRRADRCRGFDHAEFLAYGPQRHNFGRFDGAATLDQAVIGRGGKSATSVASRLVRSAAPSRGASGSRSRTRRATVRVSLTPGTVTGAAVA